MQNNTEPSSLTASLEVSTSPNKSRGLFKIRVPKVFDTLLNHGPRAFLRDALYSYYYHAEERRKARRELRLPNGRAVAPLWGHEIQLHPSLAGINEEMLDFGVHEPLSTATYQQFLRPGDHVIDVGANIGYYLWAAAKVVGEKGRFLAFEPLPSNYEALQQNIKSHPVLRDRVQLWPWAIGDSTGTCDFYESKIPNLGSFFRSEKLEQTRKLTVQVRKLDDILETMEGFRPTFLRMDVEGAELLVLSGARNLMRTYRPSLFVEFHTFSIGMKGIEAAFDEFESIGYREAVLIGRLWDAPWISPWARNRRCWDDSLKNLRKRIVANAHEFPVLTLILKRPGA
jgi:FkbM family methyltransferase